MLRKVCVSAGVGVVFLCGCGPQAEEPLRFCPGAGSAIEVVQRLHLQSGKAVSFRGYGQCRLEYYAGDKLCKENFSVKLWFSPPCNIRLQGDVAFDPRGVELGSNEQEFWLAIRPKEISTYWWGRWSEQRGYEGLVLSPKVLVEALGVTEAGGEEGWILAGEGPFDVLARYAENGTLMKKVYVYNCEYRVRKIEYFGQDGQVAASCKLSRYKAVEDEFFVPRVIEVTARRKDGKDDLVRISLESVRAEDLGEKRERLYGRRPPRGFSRVVRIVEGKFVEQE